MTYSVDKIDNKYVIIEAVSNYELGSFIDEDQAHELCTKLNMGSGFNGHTPYFFTISVEDFCSEEYEEL